MNRPKLRNLLLIAGSALILLLPATAYAFNPFQQNCTDKADAGVCANTGSNPIVGPDGVLTKAIQLFAVVIGITAVIVIIIGGLSFITSSGDPQKTSTARDTIIYASVGLAVALISQAIVAFVLNKL